MTTTRNEAAERLRGYLNRAKMHDGPYGPVVRTVDVLDEALAGERRATVERIRERVLQFCDSPGIRAAFDEEAR